MSQDVSMCVSRLWVAGFGLQARNPVNLRVEKNDESDGSTARIGLFDRDSGVR